MGGVGGGRVGEGTEREQGRERGLFAIVGL